MILEYLTNDMLNSLKINFSTNKKYYQQNDRMWFQKQFESSGGLQKSKIECEDFELDFGDDHNSSDYKNITVLYTALKHLPLSLAVDERLWSGMAHGQFWDYVQYRRKKELETDDDQKIKNSFFFTRGVKRSAHINCLSRLWWAGYLTYDSTSNNPFGLTKLLCDGAFASTIVLLSSSNLTANRELCLGLLNSIKKRQDSGEKIKREHYVEATKYLNGMGSVTILDCLARVEVEMLIDELFNKKFGVIEEYNLCDEVAVNI